MEEGTEAGIVTGEGGEPTLPEVTETATPNPAEEAAASLIPEEGGTAEGADTEQTRENDRIRTALERTKEAERKFAALESKVADLVREKEVIPAVDESALNSYLGNLRDQIEDLRIEGKHLEAGKLEKQRDKLLEQYEEWQKDAAKKQGERTEAQQWEKTLKDVDATALMYRDQYKIPAPLWDEMGQWFAAEIKGNKLMESEFIDILKRQGTVSAVRYAHEQAKPVFDARAKQAALDKAKKDAGKAAQIGGGSGEVKGSYNSFGQLMGLGSKAVEAYKKANPAHYQKLLDAYIK